MKNIYKLIILCIAYVFIINLIASNKIISIASLNEYGECKISATYPIFNNIILNKKIQKMINTYSTLPVDSNDCEVNIDYEIINEDKNSELTFNIYRGDLESYVLDTITINNFSQNVNIKSKQSFNITNELINNKIDTSKKLISLTFDDGPNKKNTERILKILKKYNVKATFFIQGNKVLTNEKIIETIVQEGHEIGNHGYNHRSFTSMTNAEVKNQINKTNELIYDVTGEIPSFIRPPYGLIRKDDNNKQYVLWNIDSYDWKYRNSSKISKRVIRDAKDGGIILMHDTYKSTVNSLDTIIKTLKEENYEFVTVSDLKKYR